MKIRMLVPMPGTLHSIYENTQAGDIIDVDEVSAARYVAQGFAVGVDVEPSEERAVVEVEAEVAVPEVKVEKKRGPGRPRKVVEPDWADDDARGWKKVGGDQ